MCFIKWCSIIIVPPFTIPSMQITCGFVPIVWANSLKMAYKTGNYLESGSRNPLTLVGAPIFFSNFAFQHFQNFLLSLDNSRSCSSFEYLSFVSTSARRMASLHARLSLLRLEYISPDLGRPAARHKLLQSIAWAFRQPNSCDHTGLYIQECIAEPIKQSASNLADIGDGHLLSTGDKFTPISLCAGSRDRNYMVQIWRCGNQCVHIHR